MITATEPLIDEPTIDVAELPALDQPDERVCELLDQDSGRSCKKPAAWMLVVNAAACGHFRGPVLVCQACKAEINAALTLVICPEPGCQLACYIRSMEPIR